MRNLATPSVCLSEFVDTRVLATLPRVKRTVQTGCMPNASLTRGAADTPLVRWLLEVAEKHGWTSGRQAAKYLGVNQAAFATWLRGDFTPGIDSQERLAASTGEPLEKVMRLVAETRRLLHEKSDRLEQDSPARRSAIDTPVPAAIRNPTLRLAFYDLDALGLTEEELVPVIAAAEMVRASKEQERGVGGRGSGAGSTAG